MILYKCNPQNFQKLNKMKKALILTTMIGGSFLCSPVFAQETHDSLGLPGDNLNLYGVLDLFQKSETLEEFEKKLNAEDSKLNNLDLNGNNKIDYISVKDNMKGSVHAIVLQVAINEKENQDVAVIEVEKDNKGKVQIQIIGDEKLYGKNYIVEPKDGSSKELKKGGTPNPGYSGTTTNVTNNYYTTNNNGSPYSNYGYPVESWGIINYLFFPSYVVYVSPWSWGFYPGYWNPWTPFYWHSYYSYNYYHHPNYWGYYHRSDHYRNSDAHSFYGQRRSTSAAFNHRMERGEFNNTYSKRDANEGREGRSPQGNRVSNSNFENTRTNRESSRNTSGNERNVSSGNERNNSSGNERNVSSGNERNNSSGNERNVSTGDNRRNNNVNGDNHNTSARENSNERNNVNNASQNSRTNSAPSSRSYSAPSNSGGGGGRTSGGGGGGGRTSGGGGGGGGGGRTSGGGRGR